MRRILRLYPALVATVLFVFVVSAVGGVLAEAWPAMLAALFYVAHLWIYTGHDAGLLEHTWTLSLEEHYYLIWLALLVCFLSRRRVLQVVGALALVLLVVVLFSPWFLPEGVRLAYERAAPMAYGSIAALYWFSHRRQERRAPRWLSLLPDLALLTLVALCFWPVALPGEVMTGWTSVPGLLSVVVVLGFVAFPMSLGARVLEVNALRWTGKRAYGLVLYQFPNLSLLAHHVPVGPAWARSAVGVLLTVVVAAASYRWLEMPFLRMKDKFRPSRETQREPPGPDETSGQTGRRATVR